MACQPLFGPAMIDLATLLPTEVVAISNASSLSEITHRLP